MIEQDLPYPLTTLDHDIEGFDGFLLNVQKLMASELWALSTGDEFKAAVGLWCRAWTQKPHGSLPDNDKVLQAYSGAGPKWQKIKDMSLRGFVKCRDGRLYHETLCEDVIRAAESKKKNLDRTAAATAAKKSKTENKRDGQRDVNREGVKNHNVTTSHRIEENIIEDKEESIEVKNPIQPVALPQAAKPKSKGARLPDDWFPGPLSQNFLKENPFSNQALNREFQKFRNYWLAKPGAGAIKLDWNATWRNWLLNNYSGNQNGKTSTTEKRSSEKFFDDRNAKLDRDEQGSQDDDGLLPFEG